jgi:hypothetical protein
MARRRRLTPLFLLLPLLVLLVLLAGLIPAPPAQAQSTPACEVAAQSAITRQGAIYSQGGNLPGDPVMPSGEHYPRTGPDSFDCSGLVYWAYQQAGIEVGWTTYQQVGDGQRLDCGLDDVSGGSTTCWAPGDLAFAQYDGGQHVSIYVGNGLFMDCYNHATGCILHDISQSSFYQSYYWQSRRISSGCEGQAIDPGTPFTGPLPATLSPEYPRFELLPDLVGYVSFRLPACDECIDDGQTPFIRGRLAPTARDERSRELLPSSRDDWMNDVDISLPGGITFTLPVLDPMNGFIMVFNWLKFWIDQLLLDLLCYFLSIFQAIVNIFAAAVNTFLGVINWFWKFGLFAWMSLRQWLVSFWQFLSIAREALVWLQQAAVWVWAWLVALWDVIVVVLQLLVAIVRLMFDLVVIVLGIIGWICGLVIGIFIDLLLALQSEIMPTQLQEWHGHGAYYMMRGILDAIHDSPVAWILYLMYALAYLAFIRWLVRFLPSAKE